MGAEELSTTGLLSFPVARNLLGSFAQVCFSTLTPKHPESLHVTLLLRFGPLVVFCFFGVCATTRFARNSPASGSGTRKFRSIFFSASGNTAATGTCAGMRVAPTKPHRASGWRHDLQALHRFCFQDPRAQNMSQRVPRQRLLPPPPHSLPIQHVDGRWYGQG